MKEADLCKNIQKSLESKNIIISNEDLCKLYVSTLSSIYEKLNDGEEIEIPNLGFFWKKGEGKSSITFFKPNEELVDLINTK